MTILSKSPWIERFSGLTDRAEIINRATLHPPPLEDLSLMSTGLACDNLEIALRDAFCPNEWSIDLLQEWVELAEAHSITYFKNAHHVLSGIFSKSPPLPEFKFPICLTGLAGIGKSQLVKAFHRVMPPPECFTFPDGMSRQIESHKTQTVNFTTGLNTLLKEFIERPESRAKGESLIRDCRRYAYLNGISFQIVDEIQFKTSTSAATAEISRMILACCQIGIPTVYVANLSLIRGLAKHPQQDRHRLLSKLTHMPLDLPESKDWAAYITMLQSIAPEYFEFDAKNHAAELYNLCKGIKRGLSLLLYIAFKKAHRHKTKVGLAQLAQATKTEKYAQYLEDNADLELSTGLLEKKRKDLSNPLGPPDIASAIRAHLEDERLAEVHKAALNDSLTLKEKRTMKLINRDTSKRPRGNPLASTTDQMKTDIMELVASLKTR